MTYCTREAQAMALDGARGTSLIRESARAQRSYLVRVMGLHGIYNGYTMTRQVARERVLLSVYRAETPASPPWSYLSNGSQLFYQTVI
jgi:hypothetical protein